MKVLSWEDEESNLGAEYGVRSRDDEELSLTALAPVSEHRSRLWGMLKRPGYESVPHGIGLQLEEESVVIRLALHPSGTS